MHTFLVKSRVCNIKKYIIYTISVHKISKKMSKKTKHYPVSQRVNWALTCTDKMSVHYWSFKKDGEYYLTDRTYKFGYPINGVISFNNHMHLMVQLTPAAHQFLLYLTQNMDPASNEIRYDASAKLYFMEFMKSKCDVTLKETTLNKALSQLKTVGYVIKRSKARRLIINPLYYFRGTMKERESLFKDLLYESMDPKQKNNDIKTKLLKK